MVFCRGQGGEMGLWVWDGQAARRFFTPEPTACAVSYVGAQA